MFLAVMQTNPPVPRKASDTNAGKGQGVEQNIQDKKTPTEQAPSIVHKTSPEPDKNTSETKAQKDAEKPVRIGELPPVSITRDWIDRLALAFSAALLIVGIVGVCAAVRTLKAVESQAGIMRGQISQMESAGQQTDKLIAHAAAQVTALADAAQAAKENAEAARIGAMAAENGALAASANARAAQLAAEAHITAERPWIVTSLTKERSPDFPQRHTIRFNLVLRNIGNTPALVRMIHTYPVVVPGFEELPEHPDYGVASQFQSERLLAPRERWEYEYWDVSSIVMPNQFDGIVSGKDHFFYYGIIRYQNTFDPTITHETRFSFKYFTSSDSFNVRGPSEYTKYT
ncbi:MAG TPA: hypothetical protein VFE08_12695 [Candidatus Sulfotelmatobacter sp.]|nr:hypothetical protein [Candidatus Sulfotelmatobacter sp.]